MKICIILGIWLVGYLVSLFFTMLVFRLTGEDPEDVYEFNDDNVLIYAFEIIFWPIALIGFFIYFTFRFLKKWYVFAIEFIIAEKELKEEKYEEDK